MTRITARRLAASLALAACPFAAVAAQAETFPDKPIRLIVPYAPGGAADTLARTVGKEWADRLGQPIIVENKPGGVGTIGIAEGARSAPDGYTVTLAAVPYVITQYTMAKLPYDGKRDLQALGLLQAPPMVLVVNPQLGITRLQDYIARARAQPGKITYATTGVGSVTHMAGELLKQQTGADIMPIPYKGGGQSVLDVIGGQIDSAFLSPVEVNQHIKAGKLIGIAVSTLKPSRVNPELKTFSESGAPNYDVTGWFGLLIRSGTPAPIVAKLSTTLQQALRSPQVSSRLLEMGELPEGTVEEFSTLLEREHVRWSKAVREANIKPE